MVTTGDGRFDAGVGVSAVSAATADVSIAADMVRRIENLTAQRTGRLVREVRPGIARSLRVPQGTLANIRRERRKRVESWLMAAIRDLLIEVLQDEIRGLEHEIAIARQVGLDRREDAFCEAEAQLAAAKSLLAEAAQGS